MIVIDRRAPKNLSEIVLASPVADVDGAETKLAEAIRASMEVWTAYYNEEIACIMGLCGATVLSDRAYLWMLHTRIVEDHKFLFIRHSQMWMQSALTRYSIIWGVAIAGNREGIRWLKWLGAEFQEAIDGKAPFTIRAKV